MNRRILPLIFFCLISLTSGMSRLSAEGPEFDYLIDNAMIYDGQSNRAMEGSIAIANDRIVGVGVYEDNQAREIIDAEGLVAAPGFIDAHTHSDFNPIVYPNLPNKLMQGVTTEIVGNCGMSAAPIAGPHVEHIAGIWAREGVILPEARDWPEYRDYQHALERKGLTTNMAALVGHGNLRSAVLGFASRAANADELGRMKEMLATAMHDGAFGVSFGLVYMPGVFANEEEITELCKTAAQYDRICAFHMRSESSNLVEAVREVISVAQKTGARIQISHLKAAGKSNWGKIHEVFELIEGAREEGLKIYADVYPYEASFAELGVQLPDDLYETEFRVAILRDPSRREALLERLRAYYKDKDWNAVRIASVEHVDYQGMAGKALQQAAEEKGKDPVTFLVDLLADTAFEVSAFSFSQSTRVVGNVLSKPYVLVGSDSIADDSRFPHPRAYGTFPVAFAMLTQASDPREIGDSIARLTSRPAEHFGLAMRGRIAPGYHADLILFDPARFRARASYTEPKVLSQGVAWVFVNGEAVVREGRYDGAKKGHFLSRGA
ncbi:MAG: D-aminoacylase [Candidatus Omnitrophota bacterium]|nr:D-aminoacylase [Candidatus Omnitrophota bacterium]